MRKFFDICKIFKPPFECVVSVNNFVFFIQNYYSIPKLPKKIELLHVYYYISIPKTGQFVKHVPICCCGKFLGGNMLQFIKLGNIIKEIRQKRGIDEKAMAKQINVSVSRYREIENGNAIYNFSTLIKIANILKVDLPEIFKKW